MNTRLTPKTILLVENEALIALAAQASLESCGYYIITAASGEAAIDVCRTTPAIDLIVMDIDLGSGMSGPETLVQIHNEHPFPVVFHSGHSVQEINARTIGVFKYEYVIKGSGISVLNDAIRASYSRFKESHYCAENEFDSERSDDDFSHHKNKQYV